MPVLPAARGARAQVRKGRARLPPAAGAPVLRRCRRRCCRRRRCRCCCGAAFDREGRHRRRGGESEPAALVARAGREGSLAATLAAVAQGRGLVASLSLSPSRRHAAADTAADLLHALPGNRGAVGAGRRGRRVVEARDGELALPPLEEGHDDGKLIRKKGAGRSGVCPSRERKRKMDEPCFSYRDRRGFVVSGERPFSVIFSHFRGGKPVSQYPLRCDVRGGRNRRRRIPGRREGELMRRQERKSKRGCYLFSLSLAALQTGPWLLFCFATLGKSTGASAAAHREREERQLRSQREERENKNCWRQASTTTGGRSNREKGVCSSHLSRASFTVDEALSLVPARWSAKFVPRRERERERSLGKRSGARVCVFSRESREEKSGRECEKFFHFFSFALERRRQEFFSSSAFLSLSVSRERETEPLDSSTQAHREPLASLSDHFRRCRAGR